MNEKRGIFLRFMYALHTISQHKWRFVFGFLLIFTISLIILSKFDVLPEAKTTSVVEFPRATNVAVVEAKESVAVFEIPERVIIDSLGIDINVINPRSTDLRVLDDILTRGAAWYPTSSRLGEAGNTIIFGHSSYLPVVLNKAFKAFNDIQRLNVGDVIRVQGSETEYQYAVTKVYPVNQEDNELVAVAGSKKTLTLITTRISGDQPLDKYIVQAEFVKSIPIAS